MIGSKFPNFSNEFRKYVLASKIMFLLKIGIRKMATLFNRSHKYRTQHIMYRNNYFIEYKKKINILPN